MNQVNATAEQTAQAGVMTEEQVRLQLNEIRAQIYVLQQQETALVNIQNGFQAMKQRAAELAAQAAQTAAPTADAVAKEVPVEVIKTGSK